LKEESRKAELNHFPRSNHAFLGQTRTKKTPQSVLGKIITVGARTRPPYIEGKTLSPKQHPKRTVLIGGKETA